MSNIIAAFNEGGSFMYVILLLSVVSLAMIIHKAYLLWFKYRIADEELVGAVYQQVEASNYTRALQYCNNKVHPLTNLLKAALLRANKSEKEIRRSVEVAAAEELPRVKRGIAFLPNMANLATMLGLLGTIHGLIVAFAGMEHGDAIKRQEALSAGIALAFRTTVFALAVAAFLVTAFMILSSKQTRLLERMEHAVTSVVDMIVSKNARAAASPRKEG